MRGQLRGVGDMLTFTCSQPGLVASFWSRLLGYRVAGGDDMAVTIEHPQGLGPALEFVPKKHSRPTMNSVHIELEPSKRDAAIERALSLGATRTSLGRSADGAWSVFRDPEGNEFFIQQTTSSYERYVTPLAS